MPNGSRPWLEKAVGSHKDPDQSSEGGNTPPPQSQHTSTHWHSASFSRHPHAMEQPTPPPLCLHTWRARSPGGAACRSRRTRLCGSVCLSCCCRRCAGAPPRGAPRRSRRSCCCGGRLATRASPAPCCRGCCCLCVCIGCCCCLLWLSRGILQQWLQGAACVCASIPRQARSCQRSRRACAQCSLSRWKRSQVDAAVHTCMIVGAAGGSC